MRRPTLAGSLFLFLVVASQVLGDIRRVGMRPLSRPGFCQLEAVTFEICYECGRFTDSIRVYKECCGKEKAAIKYCNSVTSKKR